MAKHTLSEQHAAILSDLRGDIVHAEQQAAAGPYFPEKGITADSLRAYAEQCRQQVARIEASTLPVHQVIEQFVQGKL